ncbi:hypothetical protein AYO45_02645 [Gammaproteobacteria bacterium SCGC AG-212-F23]|nr:hypothetical protein AYO45_02645 [Gammaproteobacteria bacterium SCGC AG-212-F23]
MNTLFIKPNWPAPPQVRAYTSTRQGGVSQSPFDAFNLAQHVEDQEADVSQNRSLLQIHLQLPNEPIWLTQVHGTTVLPATIKNKEKEADASFSHQSKQVCAVMTADCLPVLFCHKEGSHVAAAHAGWRGLLNGILEATMHALALPPEQLLVWLGPAIGPCHFEVGNEVRDAFIKKDPEAHKAFSPSPNQRWLANLYLLAKQTLQKQGIQPASIYGGEYCTYCDPSSFYSYRRDGEKTGRMASLIWLNDTN